MAIEDIGNSSPSELKLNNHSIAFLKETAKWTGFLSIIGFIGIGLMVIGALFFGALLSSLSGMGSAGLGGAVGSGFITVIYILFAVLYFFPVYYLYKFSANMKRALAAKDEDTLTKAFEYLKSHYKFIGILTIILLSFYVLMFLLGLLGLAAASGGF
tara:strand:- start:17365 stop:17835 length:471 start_codon:yes stop_codon:yes gene_type:complete